MIQKERGQNFYFLKKNKYIHHKKLQKLPLYLPKTVYRLIKKQLTIILKFTHIIEKTGYN